MSPVCWQNDALWQVPLLAQKVEQHVALLVHVSPSLRQLPGVGSAAHEPVAPPSLLQMPLQHCTALVQAWPVWAQTTMQEPPLHVPLQQSLGCPQPAPGCKHEAESVGNGLASATPPPEEPLEAPPLADPLDAPPLLELLDKVPSVDPSAPPDEPPPEAPPPDAPPPDAVASLPSTSPPSPTGCVEFEPPQAPTATAIVRAATRSGVDQSNAVRMNSPSSDRPANAQAARRTSRDRAEGQRCHFARKTGRCAHLGGNLNDQTPRGAWSFG